MTSTRRAQRRHVPMAMHDVAVTRIQRLTPTMLRISLGGPSLATFEDDGPDQRFKLLLPRPGQPRPVLPDGAENWYVQWQQMPDDVRPILRTYTIRRYRRADCEIDVDFVLHGDSGPASAWAGRAQLGDRAGVYGAFADYDPPPDAEWQLLVGDHTALPAVAAILERTELPANTYLEVGHPHDRIELAGDVTWLDDGALLEAIRTASLPEGIGYAWVAGESAVVQAIRRHLVNDRGMPRDAITFTGYWRRDGSIDPD